MKTLTHLQGYRISHPLWGNEGDDKNGCFMVPGPCGMGLNIIASSDAGWDHVSISLMNRVPNYKEMCWVKEQFFQDYELAIQYFMPKAQHINIHPNCLHLWRPWHETGEIITPPLEFV